MSFELVKQYFEEDGMGERVMDLAESSATVEEAALAIGCEPCQIAKTMSFFVDDAPILIVLAGDTKIDNKKYKAQFHQKAKMIPWDQVEEAVGHQPGGVCPFVTKPGIPVYLDESLKRFERVYPAAGSGHSAVDLTVEELEKYSGCEKWIDVGKRSGESTSQNSDTNKTIGKTLGHAVKSVGTTAAQVADKAKTSVDKSKQSVINVVDANGNGEIDIEDFIIIGLKTPGVNVDRADFLRREFQKNYPQDVIEKAIRCNPAQAGISAADIDKVADEVIQYERNCVSGISAALGMTGGVAMVATIPADLAQYYGYMLRAAQKLMYLYGFPEIDTKEVGVKFDSETMNLLIICLGVMYGVQGANTAIKAMATALGKGVEKKLMAAALTKGTVYPIVRSVSKWFGVNMTKQVFAGFFKKAIPVVGGVIGGGITYLSFKPCCDKLKESLQDTLLSNPNHHGSKEEYVMSDDIAMQNV
ncbi:hypothetical protein Selli1_14920 [Sellimonas catena]|uniref:YbaK/aminoacyl-tRNA synthetase-associated domain-containing protein n=1 Tax=Sellimonas catena TaxID=2994035 RepID=A0A9W6C6Y0_9FIRM|nr:hypothetical protein Selli1_14920 [Sellimonas catena]GLG90771.1 hypothetical protein Selli2_21980 [Sellimonas catena]